MVCSLVCVLIIINQKNAFVIDTNTSANQDMVSYWYLGLVILTHKYNLTLASHIIQVYSPIFVIFGKTVYPVLVFVLLPECSQLNAAT